MRPARIDFGWEVQRQHAGRVLESVRVLLGRQAALAWRTWSHAIPSRELLTWVRGLSMRLARGHEVINSARQGSL
jgi:hypothetical protein